MDRPRGLTLLAAAALALAGAIGGAAAQPAGGGDPAGALAVMAGAWDLILDGKDRKCRVTLGLEETGAGRRALRFPAGCRRALPLLNTVGGWTSPETGSLRLIDLAGEPTLSFRRQDSEDVLVARSAVTGETYRLERQERAATLPEALRAPTPPALGVPQPTPVDPAKAPPPATVPGLYAVDRYTEREVCRLALTPILLTAAGAREVRLLEGCRDAGLSAFDPVAWRYEAGRLTLTSRRGHEVQMISEREGQWRRDPEVGATLVLRKAP